MIFRHSFVVILLAAACHESAPAPATPAGASTAPEGAPMAMPPSAAQATATATRADPEASAPMSNPQEKTNDTELPNADVGGCADFTFYAADKDRKRILRIYADARGLKLKQGKNTISAKRTNDVHVELDIYKRAPSDIPECNDVGQPEAVLADTWKVESGDLILDTPAPVPPRNLKSPGEDTRWSVSVELVNVTFVDAKGARHTFSKAYKPVSVGWRPG